MEPVGSFDFSDKKIVIKMRQGLRIIPVKSFFSI